MFFSSLSLSLWFCFKEPSYVKPYKYGLKLGNVLEVTSKGSNNFDGKPSKYLEFNDVTLVPFESKLIDTRLLSREEVDWLNGYHLRVMQEVGAELKRQSRMKGFYWLMEKTKEIPYDCNSGVGGNGNSKGSILLISVTFLILRYDFFSLIFSNTNK